MDLLFFNFETIKWCIFKKKQLYSIVDSWKEEKLMSAYLIHSLPLKMSAIQIFVGDKMACVSHLVGEDTIGGEIDLQLDGEVRRQKFLNFEDYLNLKEYLN